MQEFLPMLRLQASLSVAVFIDIQTRVFPHIQESEALEQRLLTLAAGLKLLDIPWIVSEQYTQGLGPTLPSLQPSLQTGSLAWLEKMTFSCWGLPEFRQSLAQTGRNTVILAGIETHVCVLQTALDLLVNGYRVVLVEDAVGSRHPSDRLNALTRLYQSGVVPSTCESLLLELCITSGTQTFKAISKLIK